MHKCQIRDCQNEVRYNPKTGEPFKLCLKHFREKNSVTTNSNSMKPSAKSSNLKPKIKVETFVLRGNQLTINFRCRIDHIYVDRFTRAVKFNRDGFDVTGQFARYIIEIKQGFEVLSSLAYINKKYRENDFFKLQNLLGSL